MNTNNRRKFIKQLGLGAIATPILANVLDEKIILPSTKIEINKPIIISTWPFGQIANEDAWQILSKGGRALDAVEIAAKKPEGDPNEMSVGYGGLPDRDGFVTLDACIMDELGNCGSVMFVQGIKHPISLARLVMEKTPHVILVGKGAEKFALENGFKKENLLTKGARDYWKNWLKKNKAKNPVVNKDNHDTIGTVALDMNGNMSGACSTSGMAMKMHGRVGDSPVIGAGLYVDNEVGAATATGNGEEAVRICGSHLVVELMRQGYTPENACKEAAERIVKRSPRYNKEMLIAFIALSKNGQHGAYCTRKGFSYAIRDNSGSYLVNAKGIES